MCTLLYLNAHFHSALVNYIFQCAKLSKHLTTLVTFTHTFTRWWQRLRLEVPAAHQTDSASRSRMLRHAAVGATSRWLDDPLCASFMFMFKCYINDWKARRPATKRTLSRRKCTHISESDDWSPNVLLSFVISQPTHWNLFCTCS